MMSWFSGNEPYTPVMRKSNNKRKPLTPEQARHILDNPYHTGYTYARSSSYSINNPSEYINPNLSRSSFLSSSSDSSFIHVPSGGSDQSYASKAFWFIISFVSIIFQAIGDFLNTNGYMVMQFMDDMKALLCGLFFSTDDAKRGKQNGSWMLLFGFFTSILIFWRCCSQHAALPSMIIINNRTCPSLNTAETLFYQRQCLQSDNEGQHISTASTNTSLRTDEQQHPSPTAASTKQLEQEMEKIRQDISKIAAGGSGNPQTEEALAAQYQKLENIIKDRLEVEAQKNRDERDQLRKAYEEHQSSISSKEAVWHYNQDVSEEEISKLVWDSIKKLDLTPMVDESVQKYLENQLIELSKAVDEKKIQTTINDALRKYAYDRTGEADYALESAGGNVLTTRNTTTSLYSHRESLAVFPFAEYLSLWYRSPSARIVIQRKSQNVNPGECWIFDGSHGHLVIQLAQKINVSAISYEHVPVELTASGNITSAPKMFRVYSLQEQDDPVKFLIGEFIYDDQGEPLQRFAAERRDPHGTPIVEIEILSNYGASFTCLYRLLADAESLEVSTISSQSRSQPKLSCDRPCTHRTIEFGDSLTFSLTIKAYEPFCYNLAEIIGAEIQFTDSTSSNFENSTTTFHRLELPPTYIFIKSASGKSISRESTISPAISMKSNDSITPRFNNIAKTRVS